MTHPQTFHSPPALWGNRMAAATGDSLVWAGQRGQWLAAIDSTRQLMAELLQSGHLQDSLQAALFSQSLNTITAPDLFAENERLVNRIHYETVGRGIFGFSPSQAESLYGIAHQCPLAGGPAVYAARSLYRLISDLQDYDDTQSCAASGYSFRKAPEPQAGKAPETRITVYPNPARTHVYVGAEGGLQAARISLYGIMGQCLLSDAIREEGIPVSHLTRGIYFYRITDVFGDTVSTGKLILAD